MITRLVRILSQRARGKRARIFLDSFNFTADMRLLDLGCGDGSNMRDIVSRTPVLPNNVYMADIGESVNDAAAKYGFIPVVIPENGRLPFPDNFFDVVFCSSVIEHVTVPKNEQWKIRSQEKFRELAVTRQRQFAAEIRRLSRNYFVQTPHKWFPVESHTWLPFVGWLPREFVVPLLRVSNRIWVKKTSPDWNLLTRRDLQSLFPEAQIRVERFMAMPKSIMAIKKN